MKKDELLLVFAFLCLIVGTVASFIDAPKKYEEPKESPIVASKDDILKLSDSIDPDLQFRSPTGKVIATRHADGRVTVNPEMSKDDVIIALLLTVIESNAYCRR